MTVRAQAHTLEAITAGMIVLASVVFALQVTAVTPLSASTASQHIENQQEASAAGVLDAARESGALHAAVRHWDETNGSLHGAGGGAYTTDAEVNRTRLGGCFSVRSSPGVSRSTSTSPTPATPGRSTASGSSTAANPATTPRRRRRRWRSTTTTRCSTTTASRRTPR
ncbi:hypothetical protein ACFQL0_08225 [Haloplanus litoreus]|uniref:DUF7288 family protein n=1 Tax=Haloplanus litoreus TaxID=767515 RepID=UPI003617C929